MKLNADRTNGANIGYLSLETPRQMHRVHIEIQGSAQFLRSPGEILWLPCLVLITLITEYMHTAVCLYALIHCCHFAGLCCPQRFPVRSVYIDGCCFCLLARDLRFSTELLKWSHQWRSQGFDVVWVQLTGGLGMELSSGVQGRYPDGRAPEIWHTQSENCLLMCSLNLQIQKLSGQIAWASAGVWQWWPQPMTMMATTNDHDGHKYVFWRWYESLWIWRLLNSMLYWPWYMLWLSRYGPPVPTHGHRLCHQSTSVINNHTTTVGGADIFLFRLPGPWNFWNKKRMLQGVPDVAKCFN